MNQTSTCDSCGTSLEGREVCKVDITHRVPRQKAKTAKHKLCADCLIKLLDEVIAAGGRAVR